MSRATAACLLAALLACAAAPATAAGRRLQQPAVPATNVVVHDSTHRIIWDLAYGTCTNERLRKLAGLSTQIPLRWF